MTAQTRSWFISHFTVYFRDCSFGEIPIVPQLFGSFGLFSPCLIEDLFAHKDFKRALFPKEYKLVDENKIVMRDDFSPCCLHALPPVSYTHLTLPTKRIV